MKHYCQSCGGATEYALNRPNFCSHCGQNFTKVATTVATSAKRVVRPSPVVEYEEEPGEFFDLYKLDLEVEIEPRQVETLGQVVGSGAVGFHRDTKKKGSLKEFQKRNSSIR